MRQLDAVRAKLVAVLGEDWRSEHDESPLDGVDIAIHQLDIVLTQKD